MQKITKPCILIITFFILSTSLFTIFLSTPVSAIGLSTLYFTDYLDESNPIDSLGFPLLSQEPPTSSNDSYYPPKLLDGFSINQDELEVWFSYFVISFLDELGVDDDLGDFIDGFGILLPHPLRIVESYENQGEDTQKINGNVEFNLDFTSDILSRATNGNQLEISIYTVNPDVGFPSLYQDPIKVNISQSVLSQVSSQSITFEGVDITLKPGTSILFSIEMIPKNNTITSILLDENSVINTITTRAVDVVLNILKNSNNDRIKDTAEILQELRNLTAEYNLSTNDFADLINSFRAPSLVYDSINHPGSVTIPFSSTSSDENLVTYYLTTNNALTKTIPTGDATSSSLTDNILTWESDPIDRSKVLQSAYATLYIDHKDFTTVLQGNMELEVSLLSGTTEIASESITLEKRKSVSTNPSIFQLSFETITSDVEIEYEKPVSLQIQFSNGSSIGMGYLRSVDIFYGGSNYKSSLTLSLTETEHISVTNTSIPTDAKILPAETVVYTLNITSERQDDIIVQKKSSEHEQGFWDIDIEPESFSIGANEQKSVEVRLISTNNTLKAYEQDPLSVDIEVIGNTGYATTTLIAEVSEEAVTYSTHIVSPQPTEIQQGENHTYTFSITNNNTGLWPNSFIFTASSEHNYTVDVDPLNYDNLGVGNTTSVNVTVYVPSDTEVSSDVLTFVIKSKENGDIYTETINYTIARQPMEVDILGFFESLAKDLGLDDTFGDFAPFVIPILLIIVVFIILIIMVFILTSQTIKLTCDQKVKEILPHEIAEFPVTITNKSSKKQSINGDIQILKDDTKWTILSDSIPSVLFPKESKTIYIRLQPSDSIEPDDHTQVIFSIESTHKNKTYTLPLEAKIKDGVSDISIKDVSHWPLSIRPHDKVSTSFKVFNKGSIQSKQVKIKMFINGKEKNKVEDIIIPASGYAEVQIPWIAEKGKNHMSLIIT